MPPGPSLNRRLGHAILGAMQPAVWLVTTPNQDYNAVLTCLGSNLLSNGMRNSDHRFEWCALLLPWLAGRQLGMLVLTGFLQVCGGRAAVCGSSRKSMIQSCVHGRTREEFQQWALGVASQYDYDVEFAGIGRADEEATALESMPGADVGCSTQVGICIVRSTVVGTVDATIALKCMQEVHLHE